MVSNLSYFRVNCASANNTQFLGSAADIPDVGKVEMAWVPNAATTTGSVSSAAHTTTAFEGDAKMDETNDGEQITSTGAPPAEDNNGTGNGGDPGFDVADDEDRWMAA